MFLDTSTGAEQQFGADFLSVENPICLGSNRAALFLGLTETSRWIVLQDFGSGSVVRLLEIPGSSDYSIRWVPDEVQPPVWELEILGGDRTLGWSGRETLAVMGRKPDGSQVDVEVDWETSSPRVVSVTPSGVITANDIGEAFVTAEYAGWIRDSIRVSVSDVQEMPGAVMFRETFEKGNLSAWNVPDSTLPSPEVVRRGGEVVISMKGDGVFRDFLQSRESHSLQYGGTLELEVRLPLSRRDKQNFKVCLAEFKGQREGDVEEEASTGGGLCVMWPTGILSKFRDDLINVQAPQRSVAHDVDVSPHLPSDDWVHIAIQVRPDGIGRIFLNRELVFETPYVVRGHASSRWKIDLGGAAVDTELLFRDITFWRGERY